MKKSLLPQFLMSICNFVLLLIFFPFRTSPPQPQWFHQDIWSVNSTVTITLTNSFRLAYQGITFARTEFYTGVETWHKQGTPVIEISATAGRISDHLRDLQLLVLCKLSLTIFSAIWKVEDWDSMRSTKNYEMKTYKYVMTLHDYLESHMLEIRFIHGIFNSRW